MKAAAASPIHFTSCSSFAAPLSSFVFLPPMAPRQTFPIDQNKIRNRKMQLMLESPISWGTAGVALFLPLVLGLGGWGIFFASLLAAYGLRQYWRSRGQQLEASVLKDLIDASNLAQDEALRQAMLELQISGRHNYAVTLGRFLLLKRTIEQRLKQGSPVDQQRRQVENLVDELCFGVRDHIRDVIAIEEKTASILVSHDAEELLETNETRRKLLNQIVDAFGVVSETCRNIELVLQPGSPPAIGGPSLKTAIEELSTRTKSCNGCTSGSPPARPCR
jgi:hypothetical protein